MRTPPRGIVCGPHSRHNPRLQNGKMRRIRNVIIIIKKKWVLRRGAGLGKKKTMHPDKRERDHTYTHIKTKTKADEWCYEDDRRAMTHLRVASCECPYTAWLRRPSASPFRINRIKRGAGTAAHQQHTHYTSRVITRRKQRDRKHASEWVLTSPTLFFPF